MSRLSRLQDERDEFAISSDSLHRENLVLLKQVTELEDALGKERAENKRLRMALDGERIVRRAAESVLQRLRAEHRDLEQRWSKLLQGQLQREQVDQEAPAPMDTATPPAPDDRPDREFALRHADGDVVKARGILRFLQGDDVEPEPDHQPSVTMDVLRQIVAERVSAQARSPLPVKVRLRQVLDEASREAI